MKAARLSLKSVNQEMGDENGAATRRKAEEEGDSSRRPPPPPPPAPSSSAELLLLLRSKRPNSREELLGVARKLAAQAPPSRHDAWGVLTAISDKASKRIQGLHIFLNSDEHVLGRTVKEVAFQFESLNVSGRHCKIFRKRINIQKNVDVGSDTGLNDVCHVYIKDSSSNGTFVNWQKLERDGIERLQHGDIVSLVNVPEHENAFAFIFREIAASALALPTSQLNGGSTNSLKRKSIQEDKHSAEDGKRLKGFGIGCPDGPVSLDDVRRLQRSNEELRQELEAHVVTIEKLRTESRVAAARHQAEIKELRESISASFSDQIKELQADIAKKERELIEYSTKCAQQLSAIEDLNYHLAATTQSKNDAEEMMHIHKSMITELKEQLEEERNQRREERVKAEADLKVAVERARLEGSEELKRQSEAAARQQKEQLEAINKLEEAVKENRLLNETLRSKLENLREKFLEAEKHSRRLEIQLQDEELAATTARKKMLEKEQELQVLCKELEDEKVARKDAWEKVSSLELEMESAIRDLALEKQRLQGARERIVLRETQLRTFHSTAEQIASLQQKQQEQLKAMLRTLEDGDDDDDDHHDGIQKQDCGSMAVTNFNEERKIVGEEEKGSYRVRLESNSKPGQEEQMKVCKDGFFPGNVKEHIGMHDDYSATAGNHYGDDILFRDRNHGWLDGETQENDDTGSVGHIDAQKNLKITDHRGIIASGHLDREEKNRVAADMGSTQLLEPGAAEGKSGHVPTGIDANETQVFSTKIDEDVNHSTFLCQGNTFLDEETHIPKKTVENERPEGGTSAFGGEETMQVDDGDQGTMEWGKVEAASGNRGLTLVLDDDEDQPRSLDLHGQHTSLLKTQCIQMWQESHCLQDTMVVVKSEASRKKDVPVCTLDLLTSEIAGSWAMSTPGSFHAEIGSIQSDERNKVKTLEDIKGDQPDIVESQVGVGDSEATKEASTLPANQALNLEIVTGSQNSLFPASVSWHNRERQVLNDMIDIVAPEFSRRHGLKSRIAHIPDTEYHTDEEDAKADECTSDSSESKCTSNS